MRRNLNKMSFEELVNFGLSDTDAKIIIEARERNGPLANLGGISALSLSQDGLVLIRTGLNNETLSIEPISTSFRITVVPLPEMEPSFTGKVTIAYDDVDGNEQRIEETILLTERSVFEAENVSLGRPIAARVEIGDDYIQERLFTETEVAESKSVGQFVGFVEVRTFPISRPPTYRFQRRGRFVVPTKPQQRFDGYRFTVAPLRGGQVEQALEIVRLANGDQPADDGANDVRTTAIAIDASQTQLAQQLAAFALTHSSFQFDGSFEHDDLLDEESSGYVGWIWLLAGPSTFFGIQEDDSLAVPRNNVTILLPTFEIDVDPAATIPFDVSETALLDRPGLFGDDPGTNCQPFDNPGRILGERAFFSVLRVTDPELDREPRKPISKANPFPWEDNPAQFQARSVAIGHILEFRVRSRSNGYSLGDVEYSMTLAPRQTRRITQIDFDRRETASRTEQTSVTESVAQTTRRDRSYLDSVQSELAEWSRGSSKSETTGAAGGFGAAIGPFVFGGGATHGSASSSSQQSGARAVAASEQQNLRDAIRQYADSVRSLESTTVTEVAQEETVTGVTEVVRNVNHCHALSVVYYQILRHLRVDTEVGGVRECIFVPLSIEPFDDARIAQHRTALQEAVTRRDYLDALRYLDNIQSNFADNEIADGRRADQPLTTLRGSLNIHLGITRPTEGDIADEVEEGAKKEVSETKRFKELVKKYASIARFLGRSPTQLVHELLATDERSRDSYFQRSVAPHIARVFIDRMRVGKLNGAAVETFEADFTLASSYRFGRTLRVDFTVRVDGQLTRGDLTTLVVLAPDDGDFVLPERSFANLTGGSIIYRTRDFSQTVRASESFRDDLVEPETGLPTEDGASLALPLSTSEEVNTRRRLEEAYGALKAELNSNLFRYHKAIWAAMDRDALYSLLDGFTISDIDDRSLASVVEREPIGLVGNTMVFRAAASALVDRRFESPEELLDFYRGNLRPSDPLRVSLPTRGLYARAHMDSCNACEEHQGSTDWVLNEVDPALADLPASLFDSRRAEPSGLQPSALPDTLINLQNAPAAPAPTGLQGVLNAATTSDAFRDMAGLAGTQANAAAAMQAAAGLASSFGQQAVNLEKARLGAKDAKKKLDTIKKAESAGLIDKTEAKKQAAKVLDEQNSTPDAAPLTEDQSFQTALRNAASNGQAIEATRQSKDGTETIKIGEKGPLTAADADQLPPIRHEVPLVAQPNKTSCWAAAMAMIESYRLSEEAQASILLTAQEMADGLGGFSLDQSYTWDRLETFREALGMREVRVLAAKEEPSAHEWYRWMQDLGPLYVTVDGDPTHAVVVRSIQGDGTETGTEVEVLNPWDTGTTFDGDPVEFEPANPGRIETYSVSELNRRITQGDLAVHTYYERWKVLYQPALASLPGVPSAGSGLNSGFRIKVVNLSYQLDPKIEYDASIVSAVFSQDVSFTGNGFHWLPDAVPDGDHVVIVQPRHVAELPADWATFVPAGNPDRVFEQERVVVTVVGGRITAVSENPHAEVVRGGLVVKIRPLWARAARQRARPTGTSPSLVVIHETEGFKDLPPHFIGYEEAPGGVHYVIAKGEKPNVTTPGRIIKQADELATRTGHAGRASWQGNTDINDRSIGIEIVSRHGSYVEAQYVSLLHLLTSIQARFPALHAASFIGHSDVGTSKAPGQSGWLGRKQDPGRRFDWPRLEDAGFGIRPANEADAPPAAGIYDGFWGADQTLRIPLETAARPGNYDAVLTAIRADLVAIGYSVPGTGFDSPLQFAIEAFMNRFFSGTRQRPDQEYARGIDFTTAKMIKRVLHTVNNP